MYITAQDPRLRNDLYCVEWDVKLQYTIPYSPHNNNQISITPYGGNFIGAGGRSDQCSVKAWVNKESCESRFENRQRVADENYLWQRVFLTSIHIQSVVNIKYLLRQIYIGLLTTSPFWIRLKRGYCFTGRLSVDVYVCVFAREKPKLTASRSAKFGTPDDLEEPWFGLLLGPKGQSHTARKWIFNYACPCIIALSLDGATIRCLPGLQKKTRFKK